jgi:hypothetical protein
MFSGRLQKQCPNVAIRKTRDKVVEPFLRRTPSYASHEGDGSVVIDLHTLCCSPPAVLQERVSSGRANP